MGAGTGLRMVRSAGFRLWNKSWAERWDAIGRRLGMGLRMARSVGFRLWNKSWAERWNAIGRRLGIALRMARSAGFKETASLETGSAKPSVVDFGVSRTRWNLGSLFPRTVSLSTVAFGGAHPLHRLVSQRRRVAAHEP